MRVLQNYNGYKRGAVTDEDSQGEYWRQYS